MNGKIVYAPHKCVQDYYVSKIIGMIWKCDECSTLWVWDGDWRRINRWFRWLFK